MINIGSQIKQLRERLKMSQRVFGQHLKCTQVAISKIENGQRFPSYEMLKSISEFAKEKRVKVDLL